MISNSTRYGLVAAALAPVAAFATIRGIQALALRRLGGKVVVITGGSRGLGLVIARQCLACGARVAICARDKDEVSEAVRRLWGEFGKRQVFGMDCDVTDADDVQHFIDEVVDQFGGIDMLINDAGIIQVGPYEAMKREDYEESLNVHFWGCFNTTTAALPALKRRRGRIVNIASIGGQVPVPHLLPYTAGKFALVGFSEGLSIELAKDGVSVTTVCPGLMRTGSTRNAWFKGRHREEHAWFSIGGSLPLVTISAERAAHRILSAVMLRRPPLLVFPCSARMLIVAHHLAPRLTLRAMRIVNRLLPSAGGVGSQRVRGSRSTSRWSPSLLTALSDRAAARNNEVR